MIDQFWKEFVAATGIDGPYEAWAFGGEDDRELATELALLVRDGPKRATAGLLDDHEQEGDPLPVPGELSVILDGAGRPVCVIRNTEVDMRRFGDVDEAFAWDEGEGDRTLASWRQIHVDHFGEHGWTVTDDTIVVLVRFEMLWAPSSQPGAGQPPMPTT